jgi:hypothetical protein
MNRSEPTDPVRRIALALLAIIHVLGILGAPFAAKLHLFQPGATPHQNFHVVWEACKYATASLLALAIVLGPLARGERWALWVMVASSIVLFGGPAIDFWAYGSFLAVSALALGLLAVRDSAPR